MSNKYLSFSLGFMVAVGLLWVGAALSLRAQTPTEPLSTNSELPASFPGGSAAVDPATDSKSSNTPGAPKTKNSQRTKQNKANSGPLPTKNPLVAIPSYGGPLQKRNGPNSALPLTLPGGASLDPVRNKTKSTLSGVYSNEPVTVSGPGPGIIGAQYTDGAGEIEYGVRNSDTGGLSGMAGSLNNPQAMERQLNNKANQVLGLYAREKDAKKRAELRSALRAFISQQFELRYQQRNDEIASIEAKVKQLRSALSKRFEAKEDIITHRFEQLTREADGLGWDHLKSRGVPGGGGYGGGGEGYGGEGYGGGGGGYGGAYESMYGGEYGDGMEGGYGGDDGNEGAPGVENGAGGGGGGFF